MKISQLCWQIVMHCATFVREIAPVDLLKSLRNLPTLLAPIIHATLLFSSDFFFLSSLEITAKNLVCGLSVNFAKWFVSSINEVYLWSYCGFHGNFDLTLYRQVGRRCYFVRPASFASNLFKNAKPKLFVMISNCSRKNRVYIYAVTWQLQYNCAANAKSNFNYIPFVGAQERKQFECIRWPPRVKMRVYVNIRIIRQLRWIKRSNLHNLRYTTLFSLQVCGLFFLNRFPCKNKKLVFDSIEEKMNCPFFFVMKKNNELAEEKKKASLLSIPSVKPRIQNYARSSPNEDK